VSDESIADENLDVAAIVIAGVLVALSLVLGIAVWVIRARMEQIFKELGVQLPSITILTLETMTPVIATAALAGSAAMVAIRGLRVVGICAWVIALFLYLGFWALGFGLPLIFLMEQLGQQAGP
jgi:hypothetical protein